MIGVMGGTFDPVHFGHLRVAVEVKEGLDLKQLRLIPARHPPHRTMPIASPQQRLLMLRAAIQTHKGLVVDARELEREGPSYTYDTLRSLHEDFPRERIGLILGSDAFCGLPSWYRAREVPELAHFIVVHRPGCETQRAERLARQIGLRISEIIADWMDAPSGFVLFQEVTQLDISSTAIRDMIRQNKDPGYLMPEAVIEVIRKQHLYEC